MEMKEVLQLAKSDQHSAWIDLLACRRREMPQTSKSLSSTVAQQYNVQKGINTLSLPPLTLTHSLVVLYCKSIPVYIYFLG